MFYWVPNSAASAARIYWESAAEGALPFGGTPVTVPTAVDAFTREPCLAPREWVSQHYNVVRWTDYSLGGDFAALERHAEPIGEIRTFFASE